ncbi:MAG: rhomboid family intramembrane serine protease [Gammaproteobacteria bacterium]|nr:rhomboid family intramembrane serine protease [Gammaproteobacteria bacterium]
MNHFISEFDTAIVSLQKNISLILILIGSLYVIHFINWILGHRLNMLGIYPRRTWGLFGIAFSPFIHGHFNHLFFNSIPLFVLASFVLLNGLPTFYFVSVTIILLSGIATWAFGRRGFHIGASGVIMGYWGYLLINAYHQETALSIALAAVCIYYFGGLLFHLFPTEVKSSWEGHVFGFLAGVAAAYLCPIFIPAIS